MDFSIRQAEKDDIFDLSEILVGAWQAGFKNIIDQDFLDSMTAEEWASKDQIWLHDKEHHVLLAEDVNGVSAGFIGFGKLRTPPPSMSLIRPFYSAEIYAVNIKPDYWGQGLGQLLMRKAAANLAEHKHKSLCLWVMEKNRRAMGLYKKMGGERCGKKMSNIGNTEVRELCYGWRNTSILI